MHHKISLFSLTILVVSALDSIRTLPTTAYFGFSLIFYYLAAAAVFLIPVALISAEFSSRYPNEGGTFHWIRHAFGSKMGLFAVWLQWINTMVWYPTILLFIAGNASHLISPDLVQSKMFLLSVSLGAFWVLTLLNLKGFRTSIRINTFCAVVGTFLPMIFLICLGAWWFISGRGSAITFAWKDLVPSFHLIDNGNALITIMFAFIGMELAGVHVNDIRNPEKNFPRAIAYSVLMILSISILGALSVATVVPKHDIHFVDGIMQTFHVFLSAFHLSYLVPVLAILVILGATGGAINWVLAPVKGLRQAAEDGFLPQYFLRRNKHGSTYRLLIMQAIVVTGLCFGILIVPTINAYFWLLMTLSTGLSVLMYILLFLAAYKLKRPTQGYIIPKGLRTFSIIAGLLSCITTIILGFQPAPDVGNKLGYVITLIVSFTLMLLPVLFLWKYRERNTLALQTSS